MRSATWPSTKPPHIGTQCIVLPTRPAMNSPSSAGPDRGTPAHSAARSNIRLLHRRDDELALIQINDLLSGPVQCPGTTPTGVFHGRRPKRPHRGAVDDGAGACRSDPRLGR